MIINDNFDTNNNNDFYYEPSLLNRKRIQRAFYGKFKYFKEFNQDDAYFFDIIPKRLGSSGMNFIFTDLVKGNNNNLYVFTTSSLLLMSTNIEVYNIIYYFYIKSVNFKNNQICITYNQNIDGRDNFIFNVENNIIAQKVCRILIEETAKNKDNFNDI